MIGLPLDRLRDRCVRTEAGCLIWTGSTHAGYGVVVRRNRRLRLHRVVVELADGRPIPPGMIVRHVCPSGAQRACLERSHLAIGTPADNVHDMVREGRQVRGEGHGLHRLTEAGDRRARRYREAGATMGTIGALLGVSRTTISDALRGRTWGHVR